ncbi:hypothetical protein C7B61_11770 [filamentous cyanobacterium CCP1]|nr:hypothetical protein C7B76_16820 [filamentous cyanobacterium CCP2]PSB64856.1 hypothetical protein C7B61_11770 [filamentous cyanobacterium CCP1]
MSSAQWDSVLPSLISMAAAALRKRKQEGSESEA